MLAVVLLATGACGAPRPAAVDPGCEAVQGGTVKLPAQVGAVYALPFDPVTQPQALATQAATDCGPPFVLADAPELISQDGITAEAPVDGTTVFFYYARTGSTAPMYFLPTVINRGKHPITVTVRRAGAEVADTTPATDLKMEVAYLKQTVDEVVTVAPQHWAYLDPTATNHPAANLQLGVGQFLLATSGPATLALVATTDPSTADPLTMAVLPKPAVHHSAGRGLFPHADRVIDFSANAYPVVFALDRNSTLLDPYITGTDPTTGASATNVGNYGILYHVHLTLHGTPGTVLGVFLSPSGPGQSVAEGTIASALQFPSGQTVALPASGNPVRFANDAVLLDTVTLDGQGQGTADLRLLPPSGLDAQMHLSVLPLSAAQEMFSPLA